MKTCLSRGIILVLALCASRAHGQSSEKINGNRDQAAKPNVPTTPDAAKPGADQGKKYDDKAPYSEADVDQWITRSGKGAGTKFIYLPPNVTDARLRNVMRVGIFKALNQLCLYADKVVVGEDVSEGRGLVFAVDPAKCFVGKQNAGHWDDIAQGNEKQLTTNNSPAAVGYLRPFAKPDRAPAHQFVYNATHGGVYNQVMEWEAFEPEFNQAKQISPELSLVTFMKKAIVCGPRIITGQKFNLYGQQKWFFRSHDEFPGTAGADISGRYLSRAPTKSDFRGGTQSLGNVTDANQSVAAEWWFEMPNGFLAWGIHGEGGQERSAAEAFFAIDPRNPGLNLETGRCITCHIGGPMKAYDERIATVGGGWSTKAQLDKVFDEISGRHEAAMRTLVTALSGADKDLNEQMVFGTVEPVLYTLRVYEDERAGSNVPEEREYKFRRPDSANKDAREILGGNCNNFCPGGSKADTVALGLCDSAPKSGRFTSAAPPTN